MMIYDLADALTGFVEAVLMIMLCGIFCVKRENLPRWIYFLGVIVVATLIDVSNKLFNFGILNVAIMILAFFVLSFLYKSQITTRIVIAVVQYLILIVTEVSVLFGITLVYNVTTAEVINNSSYRLLGILISKMFAVFVIIIIRSKYKGNRYMDTSYWSLFFVMFSSSVVTMFLICKLTYDIKGGYIYNLSVLCSFGLLFSTVFALYLYEHLTKQAETIRNQEQYEQHLNAQLKHLDEILITQKQAKKFRHDLKNYIIGLQGYISNRDFLGADRYLSTLKEQFEPEKNVLETGNPALDAILNSKIAIAESKQIAVHTKIQIPERLNVDPTDICVIFGNALDNAIEACERVENADKRINISIMSKDRTVLCKIVNTSPKTAQSSQLRTSKLDKRNHGFGIENMKTALAKYNAIPDIENCGGKFTLKFVIFIK